MDLVERWTPSETKKEILHGVRAGNVGASATSGVTEPTVVCVRERRQICMIVLEERVEKKKTVG
jgi:hypothetical protein